MDSKKAAASRQQDRLPSNIATHGDNCIVAESACDVKNKLVRLRLASGSSVQDIVTKVQTLYPAYDRYLHSKAENGRKYGIRLRSDAMKLLEEAFGDEVREAVREHRTKPKRLYARVTDAIYGVLQRECERRHETMQDMLERIIIHYIAEKGL